jgi:hypothetical protein
MSPKADITQHSEKQTERPPVRKVELSVIAAIVIGWLFSVSPNGVFNFFSESPGFQLYPFCVAVWAGAFYLTIRFVLWHKNASWLFMVCSVLCATVFVFTSRIVEEKKAKAIATKEAPLTLTLKEVSGWPNLNLRLTNRFLFLREHQIFHTTGNPGHLNIYMKPSEKQISLIFSLKNDSELTVEFADIVVSVAKDLEWSPGPWWSTQECSAPDGLHLKCVGVRVARPLLAGDEAILAELPITIRSISESVSQLRHFHIQMRAKNMSPVFLGFWINFMAKRHPQEPEILQRIIDTNRGMIRTIGSPN